MYLKVGTNKVITTPVEQIVKQLKSELTNGLLKDIEPRNGQNIKVTCPRHKDGRERHPSCYIFCDETDKVTELGQVHCFTCGYIATLAEFIAECLEEYDDQQAFGEEWLKERCDTAFMSEVEYLPPIELRKPKKIDKSIDESILKNYEYYHQYMWQRKLSKEVVDLFEVGYDVERKMLTFPVRDEKGKLLFITARSVHSKFFSIPELVDKPVYLLYYILQKNIKSVAVVESQINALYLWSLGIPAICLFGTGSTSQYDILKKSGIRCFSLYFDGDEPGRKGASRFKRNMPDDVIVMDFLLPDGKDVNDLSYEEILNLNCI